MHINVMNYIIEHHGECTCYRSVGELASTYLRDRTRKNRIGDNTYIRIFVR